MKHPSKEMLQTSMPKLIPEVAEALPMNKCYRQNIPEIFCNYKNAVNVSKDLHTKVAEMLAQFEKKHDAEYFYSNYFSTIVKESEKYFLNIEKSASTLLASRLADKLFSFFRTPQDKLVNSEIKPKPINQREFDGLQYLSGHVITTLLESVKNSKTHLLHENQIIISILSNAILPDFAEKQNQKLVDIQTRGGLTKVVDEAQEMFILAEQLFRKTTETEKKMKKIDISAMTEEFLQDTKIVSLYKAIIGGSDTNDLDEVKVNLLENILKLYLRVRSFSFAKDITSDKKQEQRNLKFKTKGLRNDIKKLQANKHICNSQIPSTFVPNCGGRTQFLFFERSGLTLFLLNTFRSLLCMEEYLK